MKRESSKRLKWEGEKKIKQNEKNVTEKREY